jgi:P-type Cu+ transporter
MHAPTAPSVPDDPPLPPPEQPVYMGLPHERHLRRRLWVALALSVPVVVFSMGEMVAPGLFHALPRGWSGWIQWLLTTPVFFWAGAPLNRRWWISIRDRDTNMFTLTVTGTGAAYLYSTAAVLVGDRFPGVFQAEHGVALYFEATAFITSVVLLGQILEQRAHGRADAAIRELMKLAPRVAHRIGEDGAESDVPLETVAAGDRLRVRPGENVPVDGVLVEGAAEIDESMLTGEPIPVPKRPGQALSAGTLNPAGAFVMRAERVGAETLLAQIIRLVEQATESEAPIQRVADRVSAWFVPVILGVAAMTFAAWTLAGGERAWLYGLLHAVSVLIIACPCALGLATPVSLVTGIGRGARAGVLVRDAAGLEALAGADTLLIDKTGTLTEGRPEVAGVVPEPGWDAAEVLRLAASADAPSEHPVARSIVRAAEGRGLRLAEAANFEVEIGAGVAATVAGRRVSVHRAAADAEVAGHPTATLVAVDVDGRRAGLLALEDPVKPTTLEAVRQLRALGLRVVMVTGDREATARRVAEGLGLDGYHAAVTPGRKQELVREHQAAGEKVVFAGDGLNDAPALAAADVGVAMGTGTDVAMASAGLVLVKGDLRALVRAVRLSRAVFRNIRQNLAWAFGYNLAGVPLASGLLYPIFGWTFNPMFAGVAMSLSSISVVTNALRLRKTRLE